MRFTEYSTSIRVDMGLLGRYELIEKETDIIGDLLLHFACELENNQRKDEILTLCRFIAVLRLWKKIQRQKYVFLF